MGPQGTKVGSAYIEMTAKTDKFQRGMADMDAQTRRFTAKVRQEIEKTDAKIKGMTGSIGMLSSAFAAIGGAAVAGQMIKVADTFAQMRNKLSLVVKEGESLVEVEEKLYQLAIRNRAALEPTVALYTRLRSARSDLSDEQALKIVDTWNKTLVISGASAGGAAAATIQLSQAMAGGVLRAEEFNSIVENNTRAVQLFAASLGVGMGELRALVNEGKVGFDQLVKAMTTDAGAVGDEFNSMSTTVAQALTNLETAMIRFVGLQDQQFEGSKKLAEWISILANNFDLLGNALIEAGKSAAIGLSIGLILGMVKALRSLTVEMRTAATSAKSLGAAMTFLGGPWGIILGAIAAGAISIAGSFMDLRTEAQKAEDAMKGVRDQIAATDEVIAQWKSAGIEAGLDEIATKADAASEKIAKLTRTMIENGAAAKAMAEGQQLQKNVDLANALADAQKELARLETPAWIDGYGRAPDGILTGSDRDIAAVKKRIADMQRDLAAGFARSSDIAASPLSIWKPTTEPMASTTPAAASTAKAISELSGYYTALEQLERDLADIWKAEADGATGASRAAVQAMLDYLDATGDVVTVLERMKELSGGILSPADARLIDQFVAAAQFKDLPSAVRDMIPNMGVGLPDEAVTDAGAQHWATFEQRIADATKFGLMNAIETGDWADAFGQILTDVTRDALSNAIDVLFKALGDIKWDGAGTGWGSFFNAVGGSFKPMSSGGPVRAGEMLRVGELGSEWFMPKVDGYIVPNGGMQSLGSLSQVSIGDTHLHVNGLANGVTTDQLAAVLEAHRRALPGMIDARVTDRKKRGAY
jgi:tape measure domain-containing protein